MSDVLNVVAWKGWLNYLARSLATFFFGPPSNPLLEKARIAAAMMIYLPAMHLASQYPVVPSMIEWSANLPLAWLGTRLDVSHSIYPYHHDIEIVARLVNHYVVQPIITPTFRYLADSIVTPAYRYLVNSIITPAYRYVLKLSTQGVNASVVVEKLVIFEIDPAQPNVVSITELHNDPDIEPISSTIATADLDVAISNQTPEAANEWVDTVNTMTKLDAEAGFKKIQNEDAISTMANDLEPNPTVLPETRSRNTRVRLISKVAAQLGQIPTTTDRQSKTSLKTRHRRPTKRQELASDQFAPMITAIAESSMTPPLINRPSRQAKVAASNEIQTGRRTARNVTLR